MQYTLGIILTGVPQFRSSATHSNTLKYLKYQMQYTLGIILNGVPQFRSSAIETLEILNAIHT